jgi:hypothetical protein
MMSKNYETHIVRLWLENDPNDYMYWIGVASEVWEEAADKEYLTRSEMAQMELAAILEDEVSGAVFESCSGSGIASDFLSASLSEVQWGQIASIFLESLGVEYSIASEPVV